MTRPWPVVTISVLTEFVQTNGVIQDDFKPFPLRGVVQISAPVLASSAVMYDAVSLSWSRMTRPL